MQEHMVISNKIRNEIVLQCGATSYVLYETLRAIVQSGNNKPSVSEVSQALCVTRANTHRHLKKLKEKGFISITEYAGQVSAYSFPRE